MSLLLEIIVIYIKENIITKLQKLYSLPRNSRVGNKLPVLFVKKLSCTGDLLPAHKIFIERPDDIYLLLVSGSFSVQLIISFAEYHYLFQ